MIYTLIVITISFDRGINVWTTKSKTKKNKHNNEKTKLSEEVITTQRKARLLELLRNICFRLTPRKKEVNLRDLQKKKIPFGIGKTVNIPSTTVLWMVCWRNGHHCGIIKIKKKLKIRILDALKFALIIQMIYYLILEFLVFFFFCLQENYIFIRRQQN